MVGVSKDKEMPVNGSLPQCCAKCGQEATKTLYIQTKYCNVENSLEIGLCTAVKSLEACGNAYCSQNSRNNTECYYSREHILFGMSLPVGSLIALT
jgi:hypothetical protein